MDENGQVMPDLKDPAMAGRAKDVAAQDVPPEVVQQTENKPKKGGK
jgi:hypothetical protein